MKKKIKFLAFLVLSLSFFWYGCQKDEMNEIDQASSPKSLGENGSTVDVCGTTTWDLTAGQTINVGSVVVENDDNNIYITYALDEETYPNACFGDLHAWVGSDLTDLPKNGTKRPPPGQLCNLPGGACFDAQDMNSYTFTIPFSELGISDINEFCDEMLYVVTHAEVDLDCDPQTEDDEETAYGGPIEGSGNAWWFYGQYETCCDFEICIDGAVLLATENNHPDVYDTEMEVRIWKIDPEGTDGYASQISNISGPIDGTPKIDDPARAKGDNFNGNAWDADNGRFYFAEFGTEKKFGIDPYPSTLYFNDLEGNQVYSGDLEGSVGGATFYEGEYYYIDQRTDDLRKVSFDDDGMKVSDTKVMDLFDDTRTVGLGDIAIDSDGIMYGSATVIGSFENIFFTSDWNGTGAWTDIDYPADALFGAGGTQIAFGSDGVLYGVNAKAPFELFSINKTSGVTSFIAEMPVAYSDIATGPGNCE